MATRAVAVALGFLLACSGSKREEAPCADALRAKIVPALEATLDGGDADGFHRATEEFQQSTMCGPDMAALIRDWEQALREPIAKKAAGLRREVLRQLATLVSVDEMQEEAHALAGVLAKAKTTK